MIDDTHLKVIGPPPTISKKGSSRCIGRIRGGLNTKLHGLCYGEERPLGLPLTEGQVSDYTGAKVLLASIQQVQKLLADRGFDVNWFCETLRSRAITPCIPPKRNRKHPETIRKRFISNATKLRLYLNVGRIGAELPCDATDVSHLLFATMLGL